jgi:hypothetical protein
LSLVLQHKFSFASDVAFSEFAGILTIKVDPHDPCLYLIVIIYKMRIEQAQVLNNQYITLFSSLSNENCRTERPRI